MKLRMICSCESKENARDGVGNWEETNLLQYSLAVAKEEAKERLLIIYCSSVKAQKTIQKQFRERIPMTWNYLTQLIKKA